MQCIFPKDHDISYRLETLAFHCHSTCSDVGIAIKCIEDLFFIQCFFLFHYRKTSRPASWWKDVNRHPQEHRPVWYVTNHSVHGLWLPPWMVAYNLPFSSTVHVISYQVVEEWTTSKIFKLQCHPCCQLVLLLYNWRFCTFLHQSFTKGSKDR